uniref:hypothetical protein n=1 Tax=Mycobacterium sp. TaxID=1785 RepID=UPI003F974562
LGDSETWRCSRQTGLYFATGFVGIARWYSKVLAVLIKAIEEVLSTVAVDCVGVDGGAGQQFWQHFSSIAERECRRAAAPANSNRSADRRVLPVTDDTEREAIRAEGLDPNNPAVVAASELVRLE